MARVVLVCGTMRTLIITLTLSTLALSSTALADEPPKKAAGEKEKATGDKEWSATAETSKAGPSQRFGQKGQIAILSDAALTVQNSSTSGVTGSTITVSLHPALDYFVATNFSIGGFIGVDYSKTGDNHATRFGIGPRIGYDIGLSDLISVWPKIGFSYSNTSTTLAVPSGVSTTTGTTTSESSFALNLFVPLMFHPVPHFFVGFGPFLDTDLSGEKKTTVWGGKLTIGGYL